MKEFRKNEQGLFICEECRRTFINKIGFGTHVGMLHNSKLYYDKWLKEKDEGICKICNNKTKFSSRIARGYYKTCSIKCENELRNKSIKETLMYLFGVDNVSKLENIKNKKQKTYLKHFGVTNNLKSEIIKNNIKKTNIEKYGTEYPSQNDNIKKKVKQTKKKRYGDENYVNVEKAKQTKKEKYGDENYVNVEKAKQTKKEKYGDENYTNREKAKQTCLKNYNVEYNFKSDIIKNNIKKTNIEKYGVEYTFQSDEIREKSKQTSFKKYGVEYPMQNQEIFEKTQKSGFKIKYFENTNIYYRSSFEEDFLKTWYPIFSEIINAKSIKYLFKGKQHYYFPDFYIESLNLIIEIKSLYYYEKYKEKNDAKQQATLILGYNYIMIVDKNYITFTKYIY